LIISLWEPLTVARHPTSKQPGGDFQTLAGGLHTSPALITHEGWQSGIQVHVSPLGARGLLGLPAAELAQIDVDASLLLGPSVLEIAERARAAASWESRFAVVDEVLLRKLDPDATPRLEVAAAWEQIVVRQGDVSIENLARKIGWSARHLSERFRAEFGVAPKAAARIARFDRARRLLGKRAAASMPPALADLAVECGYYDQAHLAAEFRELAGCPPSRWLAEEFRNLQAPAVPELAWSEV